MVEKIIFVLFGMAWGSFLNVVIYRLPRQLSLISPPSSCPQCNKRVAPYDNIPVVSYILLRGKCRYCGNGIPISYLMVEILTPLSFLLLYNQYDLSLHFFTSCIFASAMIVLGFIDFYHQIIPDIITFPGLALALVYTFFRSDLTLAEAVMGAVAGSGFLLLVYGAYYLLRNQEGLGVGDMTMMLLIGAYLGWKLVFFTLILASLMGSLAGIYFLLFKKKDLQYALPFGTFLAPAAFIALIWGYKIIKWYFGLYSL